MLLSCSPGVGCQEWYSLLFLLKERRVPWPQVPTGHICSRWFLCPAQCWTHSEHAVGGDLGGCDVGCFLSRPRLLKVDPGSISLHPQSTPWLRQSGATRKVLLQPFWSPRIYTSVTGNLIMLDSVLRVLKDIWNLSKSQMPLKGKLLWTIIMVISNLKFHIPTSHKRHNDGQRALFNIS